MKNIVIEQVEKEISIHGGKKERKKMIVFLVNKNNKIYINLLNEIRKELLEKGESREISKTEEFIIVSINNVT